MGTDPRIQLVQSHRTITSSTFTMKFAIVVLALVAFVNAGDIATEGMQDIVDIQDYVVKIRQAADDLDQMELKMSGLADEKATIETAKNLLTAQMDKTGLTNAFNHPNELSLKYNTGRSSASVLTFPIFLPFSH